MNAKMYKNNHCGSVRQLHNCRSTITAKTVYIAAIFLNYDVNPFINVHPECDLQNITWFIVRGSNTNLIINECECFIYEDLTV